MSRLEYQQIPSRMTSGLDLLSRWKPWAQGMCNGCLSYCCHLPVEVTLIDLERLGVAAPGHAPKKVFKDLLARKVVASFRGRTGLFTLAQKSDGSCVFLGSDRRCTVYEKRPGVCRAFPSVGPRPGYCPARKLEANSTGTSRRPQTQGNKPGHGCKEACGIKRQVSI